MKRQLSATGTLNLATRGLSLSAWLHWSATFKVVLEVQDNFFVCLCFVGQQRLWWITVKGAEEALNKCSFPSPLFWNSCSVNHEAKRIKNSFSLKVSDAPHKPPCVSRTNWAAHANQWGIVYLASSATDGREDIIKNRPAGFEWWLWCGPLPSSCPAARPPSASWRLHSPSQTPVCWELTQTQLQGDQPETAS